MKINVRQSLFETNSSSTHSLSIEKHTIEETREIVNERIKKAYGDFSNDRNDFNPLEYISENTLLLKGIWFEDGDEDHNVYYIISNWMAKIQYLGMFIDRYGYYLEGYDKTSHSWANSFNRDSVKTMLENTKPYKTFVALCIEYLNTKGFNITNVDLDLDHEMWVENFCDKDLSELINNKPITANNIKTLFNIVMQDDYTILYCDEAYHPYNKPETYII